MSDLEWLKRKEVERIEFDKEVKGVMLRLGFLNSENGKDLCSPLPELDQMIAWELGVHPDSEVAMLLAQFKKYIDTRKKEPEQ